MRVRSGKRHARRIMMTHFRYLVLVAAALVALAVEKSRSVVRLWVVSRLRLASRTAPSPSSAALPPSKTTSGLSGPCLCHVRLVVLNGLRAPGRAIGVYAPMSGSVMRVRFV